MKNLLNDAIQEMVVRVNNEVNDMREEVKAADTKGHKIQIVDRRKAKINRLFKKLNYLQEQALIRFGEEVEEDINELQKFEQRIMIQVEDMYYIVNEAF
jgi:hypothetical protein